MCTKGVQTMCSGRTTWQENSQLDSILYLSKAAWYHAVYVGMEVIRLSDEIISRAKTIGHESNVCKLNE